MSSLCLYLTIVLLKLIHRHQVDSVPTCIIIDTNTIQRLQDEASAPNNRSSSPPSSSSLILRNLRLIDQQRPSNPPEYLIEPIPLSYVDIQQTSPSSSAHIDHSPLKKSLAESSVTDQSFSPCSLKLLNQVETQMVVPFEFRRLRVEQPDHHSKFLDDDPRETVPDLSTAIYERRSDPDGARFCRTCRDGHWTQLKLCETVRCDAELLRANPRLVSEWGEIKPIDGGALYAPSTVFAIYAFAFGPHCKRCEPNGQWSRYALPELCSGIKFFGHSTMKTSTTATKMATAKATSTNSAVSKPKASTTTPSPKPINVKQQ